MGNTRDGSAKMRLRTNRRTDSKVSGARQLMEQTSSTLPVALVPSIINLEKCGLPSSNSHEIHP